MPECENPLWPCAMTGAAACLAGFKGLGVIIHGSSGCYYYPATLLHTHLHCTFLLESELVMGSEERLLKVAGEISPHYRRIAVILSCVPSIAGDDVKAVLARFNPVVVESPGFAGDALYGYHTALESLNPAVDPGCPGVNIDGLNLMDPFFRGNLIEVRRLLALSGCREATVFCADRFENAYAASPLTIGTNPDLMSNVGNDLGTTLGLEEVKKTFSALCSREEVLDYAPVEVEINHAEERLVRACDKFLQRFDPPHAMIFGTSAYAIFAAASLKRYLDAEILAIGTRNDIQNTPFPAEKVTDLCRVHEMVDEQPPDLLIGSSFEQSVCPSSAFVGLTPPLRGRVRLHAEPLAGIEGMLAFMESVLNACMDRSG